MRIFSVLAFVAILALSVPAFADIYVWEDQKTGVSASFPDTWRVLVDTDEDVILLVAAPSQGEEARCKISARRDGRFLIYPVRYDSSIQKVAYGQDFWDDYLNGEYDDVAFHEAEDSAGLGRGTASYVAASYTVPGTDVRKQGIMLASLYHDTAYIAECSVEAGSYAKWSRMFWSFMKSVDFRKGPHEVPSGEYRNFTQDGEIRIFPDPEAQRP